VRLFVVMIVAGAVTAARAQEPPPPPVAPSPSAPSVPPPPAAVSTPPAAVSPPPAAASATNDAVAARVDDLARQLGQAQARLDHQAAELRALRADLGAQKDAHAAFRVGRFGVTLFGFVQADGVVYSSASVDEVNPSTGAPLNETRFLIRRARLRADADYGYLAGSIELDGNTVSGPTARITNVEVSACWPRCVTADGRLPLVMGTLGLLRIPFGFEVQQKDYVRLFLERSSVERAHFPGE
jgi:pyruvate/2-oxoglutarate dehydrogenase complex dihydrolipoamide acyltransferase (E2) component